MAGKSDAWRNKGKIFGRKFKSHRSYSMLLVNIYHGLEYITLLWNVGNYLPTETVFHHGRL